jgi:hydroxyacylglutathione hydrolase
MTISIFRFTYEPMQNNSYLISDDDTHQAVIIDPTIGGLSLKDDIKDQGLVIREIWITHAHFDHIATAVALARYFDPELFIGLHPGDLELWQRGGESAAFGFEIDTSINPKILFFHHQTLRLGNISFEVIHTPGHTPGHVIFYSQSEGIAFCGDVIFKNSIGRTDFPYSDAAALTTAIRSQILTLPPKTRLLCGHGEETTVADERKNNPFI